jgi:hypothetical protein
MAGSRELVIALRLVRRDQAVGKRVPELRPDHRKRQREQPDDTSARQRPQMVRVRVVSVSGREPR